MPESPFFDEELRKHMRNMDILLSSLSRGEEPQGNILEELIEAKGRRVFQDGYDKEVRLAIRNLEYMVMSFIDIIIDKGKLGTPKAEHRESNFSSGNQSIVYSYPDYNLLEVGLRVKEELKYWEKYAFKMIDSQNVPNDFQAARIIVESKAARDYRRRNQKGQMLQEPLSFEQLGKQRSKTGKTRAEEYREKFYRENLDIMRIVMSELTDFSNHWDIMAYHSLYLKYDGKRIRSTSQNYVNGKGQYMGVDLYKWGGEVKKRTKTELKRKAKKTPTNNLEQKSMEAAEYFEKFKLNLQSYKELNLGFADGALTFEWEDDHGKKNTRYLIRSGHIILDLYSPEIAERGILSFAEKIVMKKNSFIKKNGEAKPENKKELYLEDITLKYEDMPSGWLIRNDIFVEVKEARGIYALTKHPMMELDKDRKADFLIKDYTGKGRKKNAYESYHVLVRYDESTFEFQIRDPYMDYQATEGTASHKEFKKGRLERVEKEAPDIAWYCRAFFGDDEDGEAAFTIIKSDFFTQKFRKEVQDTLNLAYQAKSSDDLIVALDFVKEEVENAERFNQKEGAEVIKHIFDIMSEEMEKISKFLTERFRADIDSIYGDSSLQSLVGSPKLVVKEIKDAETINDSSGIELILKINSYIDTKLESVISSYIEARGASILSETSNIISLARSFYTTILEGRGIDLKKYSRENMLQKVYDYHIKCLLGIYSELIKSARPTDRVGAMVMGEFIQNMPQYGHIPPEASVISIDEAIKKVESVKNGDRYRKVEVREKYQNHFGEHDVEIERIPTNIRARDLKRFIGIARSYFESKNLDEYTVGLLQTTTKDVMRILLTSGGSGVGMKYNV